MNFKKYKKKYWTDKSLFSKVSDIIFILFIIGMLIPSTRIIISSTIIRIVSFSPSIEDGKEKLSPRDYNWQYASLNGDIHKLSESKNKVIFINFWATWCPPCVAELPEIVDLYKDYSNKVEFILISNDDALTIKNFLKKKNYNITTYNGIEVPPKILQHNSIPFTVIISKTGKILVKKKGAAAWNSKKVRKLLDDNI